jgi:hypothetical protein
MIRTGVPLWRHRDFMLLWGGQTVNLSSTGTVAHR